MVKQDLIFEIIVNRKLKHTVVGFDELDGVIDTYTDGYASKGWHEIRASFGGAFGYYVFLNTETFEVVTVMWRARFPFTDKNQEFIYVGDHVVSNTGIEYNLCEYSTILSGDDKWLYVTKVGSREKNDVYPEYITSNYTVKHTNSGYGTVVAIQ